MDTSLLTRAGGSEVVTLALGIGRDSIMGSPQSVVPMTRSQGIDASHIQGESTMPNGAGAIRQCWKEASCTSPIQKSRSVGLGAELGTSTIAMQEVPQSIVKRNSITTGDTRLWVTPLHIHGQTAKTASTAPIAHIDAKATT